jgi:hypothetical protein
MEKVEKREEKLRESNMNLVADLLEVCKLLKVAVEERMEGLARSRLEVLKLYHVSTEIFRWRRNGRLWTGNCSI